MRRDLSIGKLYEPAGLSMNAKRYPVNPSAEAWLLHAQSDLRLACLAAAQEDILAEQICFHAQQAVEKALKAILIKAEVDFPFTHDLREILDCCENAGISVPEDLQDLDTLTPYAVETRYPEFWGEITRQDTKDALDFADKTVRWAREFCCIG